MDKINVLTAMAYLYNNNPLDVFTKYTQYCISKYPIGNEIDVIEIRNSFSQFFGFPIPLTILRICLNRLKEESFLRYESTISKYRIVKNDIDFSTLNNRITQLQTEENNLINGFCVYARERFNKVISRNDAEKTMSEFLTKDGYASSLFFSLGNENDMISITDNQLIVPLSYYLAKYFEEIISHEKPEREYLESVMTGIIAYIGIGCIDAKDVQRNYRGTFFFFDTKLMLRILGVSFDFAIESATELLNEIKRCHGIPVIFEHTLSEIENAFDTAISRIASKSIIEDSEFAYYAEINGKDESFLKIKKLSLRNTIIGKGFQIRSDMKLEENISWCLPWKEAIDFISNDQPKWKLQAIENDIMALNNLHILRRGDYHKKFGGPKKLPVFVTSNTALIKSMKDMVDSSEQFELEKRNFPFVSDVELMSMIWLPSKTSNYPSLTLARNVHAVCNDTYLFRCKLKENASRINSKLGNDMSVSSVQGFWTEKVMEQYISNYNSHSEEDDDSLITTSIEEVIYRNSQNDRREIEAKNLQIADLCRSIEQHESENYILIEKIASGFRPSVRLITQVFFLKNLSIFLCVLLSIAEYFFSAFFIPSSCVRLFIAVCITIIGCVIRIVVEKKKFWGDKERIALKLKKEIDSFVGDTIPNAELIKEACLSKFDLEKLKLR